VLLYTQDLLKCIHHFASVHYAERGELWHAANEARVERRARKKARDVESGNRAGDDNTDDGEADGYENEEQEDENENEDKDEKDGDEQEGTDEESDRDEGDEDKDSGLPSKKRRRGRRISRSAVNGTRTMYRLLDGSALIVIGASVSPFLLGSCGRPSLLNLLQLRHLFLLFCSCPRC
jgi:hypothetical protein